MASALLQAYQQDAPLFSQGSATLLYEAHIRVDSPDAHFCSILATNPETLAIPGRIEAILGPSLRTALESLDTLPQSAFESTLSQQESSRKLLVILNRTTAQPKKRTAKKPLSIIIHIIDLTAAALWKEQEELSHKHIDILADLSEVIPFEYVFATDTLTLSPKFTEFFDLPHSYPEFSRKLQQKDFVFPLGKHSILLTRETPRENAPEFPLTLRNGNVHSFTIASKLIFDTVAQTDKLVGVLCNIRQYKDSQLSLLDKSLTDSMTGLWNKSATEEKISTALKEVHQDSLGVLLLVDVDNFKKVNDTLGHLAGDAILVQLCRQMARTFRKNDILGRIGGDEFLVYLGGVTDLQVVLEKAALLCSSMQDLYTGNGDADSGITLSIGIAYTATPLAYREIFEQADAALYQAKASGKNQVNIYGQSPDEHPDASFPKENTHVAPPRHQHNIVVDLIDIIFRIYDREQGIDDVLTFIGNTLHLEKIVVMEISADKQYIELGHEWCAKDIPAQKEHFPPIPLHSFVFPEPSEQENIFYCSDVEDLDPLYRHIFPQNVRAVLQHKLIYGDLLLGSISFEAYSAPRIWTQQEIEILSFSAKIISEFLYSRHSKNLLLQNIESTRIILDALQLASVFIVDEEHIILYSNHTAEEKCGVSPIGRPFHEFLLASQHKDCINCPLSRDKNRMELNLPGEAYSLLLYNTPFGEAVDISLSPITWGSKPAQIIMISEHKQSEEEIELKRKKEAYIRSICSIYELVIEIDPDQENYEVLLCDNNHLQSLPLRGTYEDALYFISDAFIPEKHRKELYDACSLPLIRKKLSSGNKEKRLRTLSWIQDGDLFYKSICTMPYTTSAGKQRFLLCVSDITDLKLQEIRQKQEEESLRRALQNSMQEIFRRDDAEHLRISEAQYEIEQRYQMVLKQTCDFLLEINLGTMTYKCTLFNAAITPEDTLFPDTEGNYADDFEKLTDSLVPLKDHSAIQKLSPTSLQKNFNQGVRSFSCQYRLKLIGSEFRWVQANVTFLVYRDLPLAYVLIHDIDDQKRREEQGARDEQYLYAALSNIIDELYEINVTRNTCSLIYAVRDNDLLFPRGGTLQEHISYTLQECIHPDDRDRAEQHFNLNTIRQFFNSTENACLTADFRRKNDREEYRWQSIPITPRDNAAGDEAYLFFVLDVDNQKKAELARIEEEQSLFFAMSSVYEELYELNFTENTYRILYANEKKYFPFPHTGDLENIHKEYTQSNRIHPADKVRVSDLFSLSAIEEFFAQTNQNCFTLEVRILWQDNNYHWASLHLFPYRNERNQSVYMCFVMDIDEQKTAEMKLLEGQERFFKALGSIYEELYEMDYTEDAYHLLHTSPSKYPAPPKEGTIHTDLKCFLNNGNIHPEDMPRIAAFLDIEIIREFFDTSGKTCMTGEFRKYCADGQYRWTALYLFPNVSDKEHEEYMFFVMDIEKQKEAEDKASFEELRFQTAIRNIYSELYEINITQKNYRLIFSSDRFELPPSDLNMGGLVSYVSQKLVHPDDRERFKEFTALENQSTLFGCGKECIIFEGRFATPDKEYRWGSLTMFPHHLADTNDEVYLIFGMDRQRQKMLEFAAKEREEIHTRKERHFHKALGNIYDSLYEVNLTQNSYRIVHHVENKFAAPPMEGSLPEGMNYIVTHIVDPDLREEFSSQMNAHTLRNFFAQGEEESFLLETRLLRMDTTYSWASITIFPSTSSPNPDEDEVYLVFIMDIEKQKQTWLTAQRIKEKARQEEESFQRALNRIYEISYELNLIKNSYRLLQEKDKFLPLPHSEGRLDELIGSLLEHRVHPDDRMVFLDFSNPKNILKSFAEGREFHVCEIRLSTRAGAYLWTTITILPHLTDINKEMTYLMVAIDIDAQKKIQAATREKELRQSQEQQHFFAALSNIYDEIYEINLDAALIRTIHSTRFIAPHSNLKEVGLEGLMKQVAHDNIYPEDQNTFKEFYALSTIRSAILGGRPFLMAEFRQKTRLGNEYRWASHTLFPLRIKGEGEEAYLVFIMDVHERKNNEELSRQKLFLERLRRDDQRYKAIVEQTDTLVFEWRDNSSERYISPEIPRRFTGSYDKRDFMDIWQEDHVIHPNDLPLFMGFLVQLRSGERQAEVIVRLRKRTGNYIWCRVAFTSMSDPTGGRRTVGTINDVDGETRANISLKYRAEYDPITGIYNMKTFFDNAEKLLNNNPDRNYYIARLDIDRFKVINELYGIEEGNKLLRNIAKVLTDKFADEAVYGRISGDIFCICLPSEEEELIPTLQTISEALAPYPLPHKISVYFGICRVENRNIPVHIMCDWANLALKTVKGSFFTNYAFYDGTLRARIMEEKKIENEMNEALTSGQFQIYLQPKVNIGTGEIISAEALSRWLHPVEGLILPGRYVPLFERNGFINKLDENIWRQTCMALRSWLDRGYTPPSISVNISRTHFHDPDLCNKLLRLVEEFQIPPKLLELELTESAYFDNEQRIISIMHELQQHGFLFSMDDFGTGYSSLSILKSLPLNIVKIDRSFLNESMGTERGRTIIRHTIAMAREMNMRVIAEGVETQENAVFLLTSHCNYAQGYYYSPPLPLADFEALTFKKEQPFTVAPEILAIKTRLEKETRKKKH